MIGRTALSAFTALGLGLAAWAVPASAQETKVITESKDWIAYVSGSGGDKVCYMASFPKSEKGDYTKRGDVMALIAHRSGRVNEVSLVMGYSIKTGKDVTVSIDGGDAFDFFGSGETAWNRAEDTKAVVGAMRRGLKMVVKGTSSRGTLTTDTYSLSGFTAAHKAINDACGVK